MDKLEIVEEIVNNIGSTGFKPIIATLEDGSKGLYIILKVISELPGEVSAKDIAEKLNISIARATVALKSLEEKNLIIREKSLTDKRKTVVNLTIQGANKLKEKKELLIKLINKALENLTIEECEQLLNIYYKIIK